MVIMLPNRPGAACRTPKSAPPPQLLLASAPESAKAAREFTAYRVPDAPIERVGEVQLIVSELVTNACRYGTEPSDSVLVVFDAEPGRVCVEVHDTSRRLPRFKPESAERQRGRGLFIVDALASDWGTGDRPMGKFIWAELKW